MIVLKNKKLIPALAMTFVLAASTTAFAASYANSASISYSLPHGGSNGTAAAADKTTSKDYGKVKLTSLSSNCGTIKCWFRTTGSDGGYHYSTSEDDGYSVVFDEAGTQTMDYYSDYEEGNLAELRMENQAETQFIKGKVKGTVYFN